MSAGEEPMGIVKNQLIWSGHSFVHELKLMAPDFCGVYRLAGIPPEFSSRPRDAVDRSRTATVCR
jgi:hypothetical protein